jgi:putative ABC transport system permease protein
VTPTGSSSSSTRSTPSNSPVVAAISDAAAVGRIDAGVRLPATALGPEPDDDIDLLVEFVDLDRAVWTPTVEEGTATISGDAPGILLARKAADDLGAGVGDTVTLRHPIRTDAGGFSIVESSLVVAGIHANPIRTFAFLDIADSARFGLEGLVNVVQAYPADDATRSDLQRAVFGLPGVASSQPVARISEAIDEALDQFVSFLFVTAAAVLVLAILIAFNATRITVEERQTRARHHARLRAPDPNRARRRRQGECHRRSSIATVLGLVGGVVFLRWMLASLASTTLPDVGIDVYLSPTTIV